MPNILHQRVLNFLLKYRESDPTFKFWLRQRDKNSRLTEGSWFQGNENYAFVGLYNRGGGTNMTRSFGIVFFGADDGSLAANIEIVWNEEKDGTIIDFYLKAIDLLGGFEQDTLTKYRKNLASSNAEKIIEDFLKYEKPKIDNLITEMGLADLMFLDDSQFEIQLNKVLSVKKVHPMQVAEVKNTKSLNTILYGPPGTGKTYNTISIAVSIANPDFVANSRDELKAEYKRLCDEGQIAFTTFHQSLSYEDFIEGIKPALLRPEDEAGEVETSEQTGSKPNLQYKIEPGIFFSLCEKARYKPDVQVKRFHIGEEEFKKAQFFKVSLGNTLRSEDNEIYEYCIENNCIALGWGGANDFTGLSETQTKTKAKQNGESDFSTASVSKFIHYIKKGNYVLISKGNYFCRAIGRVTGDYYFKQTDEIEYSQFRSVEWLIKDAHIPVTEIYDKTFSQMSIYKLDHQKLKREFFVKSKEEIKREVVAKPKNYALIIDEINRGNVSQIFGELITLIEEDKREGCPEALEVTLPYSKKKFSVPPNLYIIGTMNTADRSVEALDTALRRRFSFIEMLPLHNSIEINDFKGIDLRSILETLNKRLEVILSRDHLIGHSFFLNIDSIEKLHNAFFNKIIPQLQEYFFGDYGKIGLILGKGFINTVTETVAFADFEYDDKDVLSERKIYRIKNFIDQTQRIDENKFLSAIEAIVHSS